MTCLEADCKVLLNTSAVLLRCLGIAEELAETMTQFLHSRATFDHSDFKCADTCITCLLFKASASPP